MRRVQFYLGTGFSNVDHKEVVEFEDGTPDEEIEECFEDWKNNYLDCAWWDIKE